MTHLDGPSVVTPDQSLEQLASGMHQAHSRERGEALVDTWHQDVVLGEEEAKSLVKVIESTNKRWEGELEMKRRKASQKQKGANRMTLEEDEAIDDNILDKNEEMSSANILGRWQEGKRQIKLSMKAANASQDVE